MATQIAHAVYSEYNRSIVVLPVFDAFLLKQRLGTAKRLLSSQSQRLYSHVNEIVYNLSLPDVESNIPPPERKYIMDTLMLFMTHMSQSMPESVLAVTLDHVLSFAEAMDATYD